MNRTGMILLLLLLLSNAAWLAVWFTTKHDSNAFDVDTGALEREVDELQLQLADLRRAEPTLIGTGEGHRLLGEGTASTEDEEPAAREAQTGSPTEGSASSQAELTRRQAEQKAYAAARAEATAMLKKVLQVEDPALREDGLAEMAAALAGTDTKLIEYTLSALYSLRTVDFDRAAFRGIVEQHLDSADGGIRRSALYALYTVDPQGVRQGLLLERAADTDPRVRSHIARLLALTGSKTFEGASALTTLTLLSDQDPAVRKGTLRGLSDARVTPELARRLIEMAATSPERNDAITFGLSRLKDKSRPVVDALLTHLDDEDQNIRARAHWGLQREVGKGQQLLVAQGYAARLGKFLNPKSQREALKLIARYGDDRLAPQLEQFAANEMVDRDVRAMAAKAAEHLRNRKPR